jgi:hypothetical protein
MDKKKTILMLLGTHLASVLFDRDGSVPKYYMITIWIKYILNFFSSQQLSKKLHWNYRTLLFFLWMPAKNFTSGTIRYYDNSINKYATVYSAAGFSFLLRLCPYR